MHWGINECINKCTAHVYTHFSICACSTTYATTTGNVRVLCVFAYQIYVRATSMRTKCVHVCRFLWNWKLKTIRKIEQNDSLMMTILEISRDSFFVWFSLNKNLFVFREWCSLGSLFRSHRFLCMKSMIAGCKKKKKQIRCGWLEFICK